MIIKRRLKPYLLLALALFVAGVMIAEEAFAAAWFNDDWLYRKQITVVGPVTNGPHTYFPILVNIASDADLQSKAQSDGGDIIFTNASGIKLDHETVRYNNSTGELIAWIEVDSINDGTVIYMYYGNSSGGLQYGLSETEKEATWDEGTGGSTNDNFTLVYHLNETNPNPHLDSTSYDRDTTTVTVTAQGQTATSKIDGADEFNGSNDIIAQPAYITLLMDRLTSNDKGTVEVWIRPRGAPDTRTFVYDLPTAWGEGNGGIGLHRGILGGLDRIWAYAWDGSDSPQAPIQSGVTYAVDTWVHITWVFDSGTLYIYKNGDEEINSQATFNNGQLFNGQFLIGKSYGGAGFGYFNGYIDEVHVSNVVRNAGWINTTYNNQNNPSSFLTFSEQVSIPTMTEWGMIIFMVLAGLGSIYYLRRQRRV